MSEQDYVLRIIERLGRFLARLTGLRAANEHERALRECDDAIPQLLGIDLGLVETVDAQSAVRLLGSAERVEVLTRILAEKVELLRTLGRTAQADALAHRISALQLAADACFR